MRNQQGDFIWYELMTTDPDAAARFYGGIYGWQVRDSGTPGMDYRIFSADGVDVAGLMPLPAEACEAGASPGWLGYIAVEDVDTSVDAVTTAGGQVHMPPRDIPGVGRLAMLSDPQGTCFYLMRGAVDQESQSFDQSRLGQCCWNELTTGDPAGALGFYQQQFGWHKGEAMDMGKVGVYQLMRYAGRDSDMGAIAPPMNAETRPAWSFYFNVADIDAACERIAELGGQVDMGPHEVPGGMFIIIGYDPQGASFALIGPRQKGG